MRLYANEELLDSVSLGAAKFWPSLEEPSEEEEYGRSQAARSIIREQKRAT